MSCNRFDAMSNEDALGNKNYLTNAGSVNNIVLTISHLIRGSKENAICSNRGICDTSSGICECSANFDSSNGYNQEGSRGDCGYQSTYTQYCPGLISCSGHGSCTDNPQYRCICASGWTGADCSEKLCPSDYAWFGYAEEENVFHLSTLAECSNVGLCDRVTGTCRCQAGFTGAACNRLSCPSSSSNLEEACSNHGLCYDISTLATLATTNGELAGFSYGGQNNPNNPYTWDANRIYGCYCDAGYTGYDCSLHTCPYGSNPDAVGELNEVQLVSCTVSSANSTNSQALIHLTFREQTTTDFSPLTTTTELKSLLEGLSSINSVAVELFNTSASDQLCTETGNAFLITFLSNPGDLPLIKYHTQNIDSFDVQQIQAGSKSNVECNDRGICDRTTGLCQCFPGYGSSDGQGNAGSTGDCGYIEPIAPVDQGS
jgi:hypothetical protein